MSLSFSAATRDSLSNLAASLNAGKDKTQGDAFFLYDLDRAQVEAMYRGDWLARKIVDIVPYDMVREWRAWSGERAAVQAAEAAERRFGVRKLVQRALVLGRLYGGAAIIVGTGEERPEALAAELHPETLGPGDIRFLHVVSRWQVSAPSLDRDLLSPWFGEPAFYEIVAPGRGALRIHPSRVLRFLGNELPDPSLGLSAWSDSILQTLYDAIHAVALTTTGATSLMHEAKVDVVTVPNLSEHLSSASTTAQLSARFAYAAAMKSLNNLLLLGDGETWSRQKIDFAGLPEMVRTFLQVAAGAADIPVTRLLGQSPAGLSATGESDTRNYYDHVSARQELDLRPQLERLDALLLRAAGVDPAVLSFAFRPLWQMDGAAKATIALQKAQATQIYAGLNLWPAVTTARLVEAQLAEDGTYPGAEGIFAEAPQMRQPATDFDPSQPRDPDGRWTAGEGTSQAIPPPEPPRQATKPSPSISTHPDLLVSLAAALNPVGTAQAEERGSEAASSTKQVVPSPQDDPNNDEESALLRTTIFPVLALLAVQNLVRSAYKTAANFLTGRGAEPSEPSIDPAEQAPTEPADNQDPYKNQDIPFDRSNLENKIKNYLLKSSHESNGGKADFFQRNLGFSDGNWEQLANQVDFDKSKAVFDPKRTDSYGNVYYHQEIRVVGANGRSMTLNGAFAVKNGRARLTTLLPD